MPPALLRDPTRLHHGLFNLLGNALTYTDQGSVTLRVVYADHPPAHADVTFSVVDTGIGLAISQQRVEAMGGKITVQSEPGHVSTFTFTLRLARANAEDTAASPRPPPRGMRFGSIANSLVSTGSKPLVASAPNFPAGPCPALRSRPTPARKTAPRA